MTKTNYRGVSWVGIEYNTSGWVSPSLVKGKGRHIKIKSGPVLAGSDFNSGLE